MRHYLEPVNPLHHNPVNLEDMWWVDGAWSDASLSLYLDVLNEWEFDNSSTVNAFAEFTHQLSQSNLPVLVATPEWAMKFLTSLPDGPEGIKNFRSWDEHQHLSEAVRLYAYVHGVGETFPETLNLQYAKALLLTAEFTDADLKFLFVDGGASIGMRSRADVTAQMVGDHPQYTFDVSNASGTAHGAVPWSMLYYAFSNHSFGASPYALTLVNAIAEERDRTAGFSVSPNTAVQLFQQLVKNPTTTEATLEAIVAHTVPELALVEVIPDHGKPAPKISDELLARIRAEEARGRVSRLSRSGSEEAHTSSLRKFFSLLATHPNWSGKSEQYLPMTTTPGTPLSIMESTVFWPTYSTEGAQRAWEKLQWTMRPGGGGSPTLFEVGTFPMTYAEADALDGLSLREPTHEFVKEKISLLVRTAYLEGFGVDHDGRYRSRSETDEQHVLSVMAFGFGAVLRGLDEVRDAFGGAADDIPPEWIAELVW